MERSEFERLALEQLDALHRMAFQLSRSRATAADLVQETYLRALRSENQFSDRGGGIRPWLFAILHNIFYSYLQSEAREPVTVEEIFAADENAIPPGEPQPAWDLASLDWEHVDSRISKAIDNLGPDMRMILLLWAIEGLKYREIAEIIGIPTGTVMSRLHRARQRLAAELVDLPGELGVQARGWTDTND